jgi:Helix-turn-helix domain
MDLDANQKEILKLLGSRWKAQNLFSVEELAQFLEVSVRSIRRMHAEGIAPPRIRRSRRLMYPVNGVIAWLPGYLCDDTAKANLPNDAPSHA